MELWITLVLTASLFVPSRQQGFVSNVAQNYNEKVNNQLQQQVSSFVRQEVAYLAYASFYDRADVSLPGFHKFFSSLSRTARENARNLTDLVNQRGGRIRYPVIQLKDACKAIEEELGQGKITKPTKANLVTEIARKTPHICNFLLVSNPYTTGKKKEGSSSFGWAWSSTKDDKDEKDDKKDKKIDREPWQDGLYGLEDALALERAVTEEIYDTYKTATTFHDPITRHRLDHFLNNQVERTYEVSRLVDRLQEHRSLDTYILEEYLLDSELQEISQGN